MELPPGVFESDSRASTAIGVVSTVLSVTFLVVALRIYTRLCILKQIGMDDWAAMFTLSIVFGCGFAVVWNVRNGLGRHVYFLSPEQIKDYMKTFYTSIILYNAALGGIKMTFLIQYYRVLAVNKMKKIFIGAMVFVGAWSVSQMMGMIFICWPIAAFWDKSIPGTCLPNFPLWYSNAAGNIFTDILVLLLPLPGISRLKLRRGQKYVLLGIFCLGFFTCIISVVRIRFLHLEVDFTWENVESSCWSVAEVCSGLTCACLPACRPLASRFIPALSTRTTKSSTHRSHGSYPKKTGNKSQQRDLELGESANLSHRLELNPHRRLKTADSKAELYTTEAYNTSQEDWSHEGALPVQLHSALEHPSSTKERMPLPVRQQKPAGNDGYKSRDDRMVETRIEAGLTVPDSSQPNKSIEVTRDIVQISSSKVEEKVFA
ncbi:hypothetical protein CGRA01v4_08471 [Colletotrichum graminicola]|uniref:Rhodopsin domain-containing protein n=1 Tax=Colletotrichum graminicola (strain M1.001 / M2 / FGSC 10212) TaxID=645133 RepID=E3R0V2_COLGM|nr:uncharacterized protein GLRG_11886 [Colletotrichum graminicola M1.001]EFQ36740.1 hypothetical protein GLRG_11886 [Colletotrichum graminicola M1.001]WDK17188.1 hypothetical protein CGRA01v4_08471 [Colletotrichum graminicola]